MRTLTADMTDYLALPRNVEPVLILGIDWSGEGHEFLYADKNIAGIDGRILEMSQIDSVLSSKTGTNFSLKVVLTDTDGSIKEWLDDNDPYNKDCRVYQYFDDRSNTIDIDDKFLLFVGKIKYDVIWSEGTRDISLTIVSEVEQREVGFSPEEGQFDFVSKEAVGRPWPLCFGSPLNVPATKITGINTAILNDQIIIVDPVLYYRRRILYLAILQNYSMEKYYEQVALSTHAVQQYSAQSMLNDVLYSLKLFADEIGPYNEVLSELMGKKADEFQAIRGRINQDPQAIRDDMADLREDRRIIEDYILGPLQGYLEELVEHIPILEASIEQRANAYQKQVEAVEAITYLFQEYIELDFEIARQERLVRTQVRVKNYENFPQGEQVDVLINNVRFRGTFNDDVFTIDALIPRYSNITLAEREEMPADYRFDEQYATFWVQDERIRLEGMYIWVHSSRTNAKHIAKVVEQNGRLCVIELNQYSNRTLSDEVNDRVNWSSPFVPVGTRNTTVQIYQNFYPIGNFGQGILDQYIVPQTAPEYMTSLGQLPYDVSQYIENYIGWENINNRTFDLLLKLSKIRERDNQLYVLTINGDLIMRKLYTLTTFDFTTIIEASPIVLSHWLTAGILVDEIPQSGGVVFGQGTPIIDESSTCHIYVANIIESTVLGVSAYRTIDGHRSLTPVPAHLYSYQNEILGPLTLATVRLKLQLSSLNDGWEDQIFVTLESSVGPNVVDVIQWLIETYTDKSVDSASFTSVHGFCENYPVHFCLTQKRNVFDQINDIASLARCVVYLRDDTFFIKYLPRQASTVATIGQSDVLQGQLVSSYTDPGGLATRITANWIEDYASEEEPFRLVLRNNMPKYGLHDLAINYYIYNNRVLVEKSATFELIRRSNIWRMVQIVTPLKHLKLEVFDSVVLNVPHVPAVTALVESLDYDLRSNTLTMTLWLPVRAGEQDAYVFAWPSLADSDEEYFDNPGTGGLEVTGTLPEC